MRDDADLTTDAGDSPSRAAGERIRHLDLDLLSLHIDGRLDPGARGDAEAHLAACPACSLDYTELRLTVTLLQGLPQYEPRRSFALGTEYGKIRRRPLPPSRQAPALPSSPYLPPPPPARETPWFARALPGTRTLTLATGAVAVALFAAIAGDALVADPPASPALSLRTGQVATSIRQPAGANAGAGTDAPAVSAAPAAPAGAAEAGETAAADPALQQENGAPAAVAASSNPSPWRIAQIGLAMLLLWLLVSLAGRYWMDRHEALPS